MHYALLLLLSICAFVETGCYTYVQQSGDVFYYSSSIAYLVSGILIAVLPFSFNDRYTLPFKKTATNKFAFILLICFLTGMLVHHLIVLIPLYKHWQVDKVWADMLPTIKVACQRFLQGVKVYGPAPELWTYSTIPYLPMMWIPFLPSEILGFDMRWTTVFFLFLTLFVIALPITKSYIKIPVVPAVITLISLFMLLNFLLTHYNGFWAMTQESVIGAYYCLLAYSLFRRNHYLTGFLIACCLLSRYSFIGWIPVYFIYFFFTQSKGDMLKLFGTFSLSVLFIFILPFFIQDPYYFINSPKTYSVTFPYFWKNAGLDKGLYYNVGLYKFFTIDQIDLIFKWELATGFLAPLAIFFVGWKYKLDYRLVTFGALKISIVFFYNFLQAPIIYLYFVPTLISYVVLFELFSKSSPLALKEHEA